MGKTKTKGARGRANQRRGRRGGATRRAVPVVDAFDIFEGVDPADRAEIEALVGQVGSTRGDCFTRRDNALWVAAQLGTGWRVELDSVPHRLRCAEVTTRDHPAASAHEDFAAFLVEEGPPPCERMTMSALVRKALCAMPARVLWHALSMFDAEPQRETFARELAEVRGHARAGVLAWCGIMAAGRWFVEMECAELASTLGPAHSALDVAVAHAVAIALEMETVARTQGSEGALRRRWSSWLVEKLTASADKDRDDRSGLMTQVEIAELVIGSASWPMPPCPAFAARYKKRRSALVKLLDADAGHPATYAPQPIEWTIQERPQKRGSRVRSWIARPSATRSPITGVDVDPRPATADHRALAAVPDGTPGNRVHRPKPHHDQPRRRRR